MKIAGFAVSLVMSLGLCVCAAAAPEDISRTEKPDGRMSVYALGDVAVRNLVDTGIGYGEEICSARTILTKDDIKAKAWTQIRARCNRFAHGLRDKFSDDTRELFFLCVGGALDGCQRVLGVAHPCYDLASCHMLLGVPDW